MNKEILEFMHQAGLSRGAVERVAEMLPADDEELANWIDDAVHESDSLAFMLLVYAAFVKERPVDAKHLISGARVSGGPAYLVAMMFGMHGEVPECLLEGMKNTAIHNETAAAALFAAAVWCDENRGGVYPDGLLTETRTIARRVKMVPAVDIFLISIAEHLNDPVLQGIMRKN